MKLIRTENAKPGMVVAKDIYDLQDRVIVKVGTTLTEIYIKKLLKWGITEIWVQTENEEENVPRKKELTEERLKWIEHQFEPHRDSKVMTAIKEIVKKYQWQ